MVPEKLIIFDYSGTLSLESTLFARPDYLMNHLIESGLMDLGISSPDIFWEQIVNPTWLEGSTTTAGYKKVIEDRISAICHKNMSIVSCDKISDAASSFVDSYLSHSRIDWRWQPILIKLGGHPSIRVIIATDHYAEATGYIVKYLKEFQVQAIAAKAASAAPDTSPVIVANSADLGVHKNKSRFWAILKAALNISAIRHILLIDDFGSNEQKGDSYGTGEKVEQRKCDTIRLLQGVFSAEVQVVHFMIDDNKREKAFGVLIKQTSLILDRYLSATNDG
jgi:hypothetical protein